MLRYVQLLVACVVLGAGIAFLLDASLGSDGYSTLVNGLSLATGSPFWVMNILVAAALVATAWLRGTRPGPGTIVQPLVVGIVVSGTLAALPAPVGLVPRVAELVLALGLLAFGVAGYLASHTGAGPAEAVAVAWDPPVPFRWSYSAVQGGGAFIGWLLGSAVGPGTVLVILLLGPAVDLLRRRLPHMERADERTSAS
jgi:uncharacterized membrane protein YczE